ncbi:MAG: hypothetical protein K2N67_01025 [Mucispirillum sp.]|nr:hypothetical protein [Mucispirillum sp.]
MIPYNENEIIRSIIDGAHKSREEKDNKYLTDFDLRKSVFDNLPKVYRFYNQSDENAEKISNCISYAFEYNNPASAKPDLCEEQIRELLKNLANIMR